MIQGIFGTTTGLDREFGRERVIDTPLAEEGMIVESVKKTGRLLVADTSWKAFGVCAEVCRIVCEQAPSSLKAPAVTVGMQPSPCPTDRTLEDMYYPNLRTLSDTIATLVTGDRNHGIPLSDEKSMADVYKRFRDPF